jgi:acid phosphatase family membrane protein YuiD
MASLALVATNWILLIPISAMVGVQLFKFLWQLICHHRLDVATLFATGGMPSSHSALVTSLATAVGLEVGFDSTLFAVATVLALIVMYDARGVRQESGQHARMHNRIARELFAGHPVSDRELKELIGHTTIEVFVGAVVGMVYTVFMLWLV